MISVIAQERLLGAALGSTLTGFVVFTQRKSIHKSITDNQSRFYPQSQITEHIPKVKASGIELAHVWNKTVDQVFGPVIKYLGSRGW